MAVNNLQSQHQRRRAPFSPQPLQPLSCLRLFDKGRSDRYEMIPPCTFLIYTSVTIHYVESFLCGIFKNNVSKTDLLRSAVWSLALFWILPPTPNPPRTSAEDGVSIYSPRSRCISHCCYQKRPQGGSTSRSALLLAKLIFIFSWSRVDFRCCACFRFTGTWFNYIENCIYSFSGLPQGGSFRVFGRLLCVIQEVLLDYLSDNTL